MTNTKFDNWLEQRPIEAADPTLEARIMTQAQVTSQQEQGKWKWANPIYGMMAVALVAVFLSIGQPVEEGETVSDEQLFAEIFYYDDDTIF